jgi:hypothetical protein
LTATGPLENAVPRRRKKKPAAGPVLRQSPLFPESSPASVSFGNIFSLQNKPYMVLFIGL